MNKPPKEQARDYVWHNYGEGDFNEHNWDRSAEEIWLAGYQAAKDEYKVAIDIYNDVAKQMMEEAVRIMSPGGQVADVGKVMPQWISVKDRLPESISDVLILTKEKESHVAYYRDSDNDWNMYNPCCSFHMQLRNVTHWMPLPAPPEEEK